MSLDERIVRTFAPVSPQRIILFGSQATGTSDEASDVDLIVVYETNKRFLDRLRELYLLWDLRIAVDILAYTPVEFARLMKESAFVQDAVATGREIYAAA